MKQTRGWALGVVPALVGAALACGGGAPSPAPGPAPEPATSLPAGWDAARVPASRVLGPTDRTCAAGPRTMTWRRDGTFLVTRPDAKFGGTWKLVDADIVYVTTGPMGPEPRCSAARFLVDGAGEPQVLLCAEGPLGCVDEVRWAVEVLDAGGGAGAVEAVALRTAGIDPSFGPGVVFRGDARRRGRGIIVRYRESDGGARRLAEHLGSRLQAELGPVPVRPDPRATSPVVVDVGPSP